MLLPIAWAVMVALLGVYLWALVTKRPRLEWVIKPLAAATFVTTGYLGGALETTWGTVLFAGLVLAALGDLLLIPKDRRSFLGGLVSFLLGHVAYGIAFGIRGLDLTWAGASVVGLVGVAVPVMRWLWPHVEGPMRGPVAAYVAVITVMVALAFGTFGATGDAWLLVGAIGFYLSDLAVARQRFVHESLTNRLWGLPLYFGSQLLLAGTVS